MKLNRDDINLFWELCSHELGVCMEHLNTAPNANDKGSVGSRDYWSSRSKVMMSVMSRIEQHWTEAFTGRANHTFTDELPAPPDDPTEEDEDIWRDMAPSKCPD